MAPGRSEIERMRILRARGGDEAAIGELIDAHSAALIGYVVSLIGDHHQAEDLAQETFLRALEHLDKFDPSRPFRPWLLKIGRNLTLNWLNSRAARERAESDDMDTKYNIGTDTNPEDAAKASERISGVKRILELLPVHFRDVLHLRYIEGYNYEEISRELELPAGTVKTWLHRAKKAFLKEAESSGIQFN